MSATPSLAKVQRWKPALTVEVSADHQCRLTVDTERVSRGHRRRAADGDREAEASQVVGEVSRSVSFKVLGLTLPGGWPTPAGEVLHNLAAKPEPGIECDQALIVELSHLLCRITDLPGSPFQQDRSGRWTVAFDISYVPTL